MITREGKLGSTRSDAAPGRTEVVAGISASPDVEINVEIWSASEVAGGIPITTTSFSSPTNVEVYADSLGARADKSVIVVFKVAVLTAWLAVDTKWVLALCINVNSRPLESMTEVGMLAESENTDVRGITDNEPIVVRRS